MRMILMVFISMLMIAAAAAGESVRAPEGLAHVERQGRGEIDLVLIPGLAARAGINRSGFTAGGTSLSLQCVRSRLRARRKAHARSSSDCQV